MEYAPGYTTASDHLAIAAAVLGQGRTSRLYRRLVYQEQVATEVSAFQRGREIAGQFQIAATARSGVALGAVEKALDEELEKFLAEGPTAAELARVKARWTANFIRGLERIGGFGGKSDALAQSQVFGGSPDAYKNTIRSYETATPDEIKRAAGAWLPDGVFVLEVHPFPTYKAAAKGVDRSKVPEAGAPPQASLPRLQRMTLSNGLKVILAERHEAPLVSLEMLIAAGAATDTPQMAGAAGLAGDMLITGTKTRNAIQIGEEAELLGANLSASSARDTTSVRISALRNNLDASLALWADVVLNPAFEEREFRRVQKQALASIAREKSSPTSAALRVLPGVVYGKDHPYGTPVSGSEKSVSSLTRQALLDFHNRWFKPNNATLAIVGDTTLAEIAPRLEKLFAGWKSGEVPKKQILVVGHQEKPSVYLIDKPGAPQSVIVAGHIAPPRNNPEETALEILNAILGGAFVSRINMNLREDKHWSYGARTVLSGSGQRLFYASAPIQADKTKESMIEIKKEFSEIIASRPASDEEMERAREQRSLRVPGQFETSTAVLASIGDIVRNRLPDDFFDTFAARVRALKKQEVMTAAEKLIKPDRMVWVIVGDRAQIEAGIRELNYGELRVVDADGNPQP